MWDGCLRPSQDSTRGERYFANAPGIDVRQGETAIKAESYLRYAPLCADNVFSVLEWEVMAEGASRVPAAKKYGTDQWVQSPGSVPLRIVWVQGCSHKTMSEGLELQASWSPSMESKTWRWTHTQEKKALSDNNQEDQENIETAENESGRTKTSMWAWEVGLMDENNEVYKHNCKRITANEYGQLTLRRQGA